MNSKNEGQSAADFVERVRVNQRKLKSDLGVDQILTKVLAKSRTQARGGRSPMASGRRVRVISMWRGIPMRV